VRNHLPVPQVDPATYRLHIEGEGLKTISLTLEELKTKFRRHSVATTVM
jgi:sulfite oxidase